MYSQMCWQRSPTRSMARAAHSVEHLRYGTRIFHHVGHQLADDGLVLPVHLVIFLVDRQRRVQIHAGEGVQRRAAS